MCGSGDTSHRFLLLDQKSPQISLQSYIIGISLMCIEVLNVYVKGVINIEDSKDTQIPVVKTISSLVPRLFPV